MLLKPNQFEENVQILSEKIPNIAMELAYLNCSSYEFCQTRQQEYNLKKKLSDGSVEYFHSNYNACKEAQEWAKQLDLKNVKVLYVYGVGLGYQYLALKPWLAQNSEHHLVFLEHDLVVLHRLLETENGAQILRDQQVLVQYVKDVENCNPLIEWLSWHFVMLTPEVYALPYYEKVHSGTLTKIKGKILHSSVRNNAIALEYLNFSQKFFENYYANLLLLPQALHGEALFGKFQNIPAIICGAGPSLNKNLEMLKNLKQNALIFAGGSALNALSSKGILPHFGAGIDPNPAQYQRISSNLAYEVPFFYRNRIFHKALESIHGPKCYLNGSGGYDIAHWIEQQMGIASDHDLDEGYNVVNLRVEIARHLGCSPIIFVGMDLAYTDQKFYASGVLADCKLANNQIATTSKLLASESHFLRNDIYGTPVSTLWKWICEAEWLGEHAKNHPSCQYINATEGGIGMPHIPNMSLAEAKNQFLQQQYPMPQLIQAQLQQATPPDITCEKVLKMMGQIAQSLNRCTHICTELIEEIKKVEKKIKIGKTVPANLQSSKGALLESELVEEIAYQYLLHSINIVRSQFAQRRFQQIIRDNKVKSDSERSLLQLDINAEKIAFLKETARSNLQTLQQVVTEFAQKGEDVSSFDYQQIAEAYIS